MDQKPPLEHLGLCLKKSENCKTLQSIGRIRPLIYNFKSKKFDHNTAYDLGEVLDDLKLSYKKIDQNDLDPSSPFIHYASPSVLIGDEFVFGSKVDGGQCCTGVSLAEKN